MANFFKNSLQSSIGTSGVVAYTCPAGRTSTVIGVSVANIVNADVNVSVQAHKAGGQSAYVLKGFSLAQGSSVILFGGDQKLVLESGDFLSVTGSASNSVDSIVSVLEQG